MPEKCALSHGSGVLGRDPRDSCRFWSPHVENMCTVTQIRLGEGGGWGYPFGGGGSANREVGSKRMQGCHTPPPPHGIPPPAPPPPPLWCGACGVGSVVVLFPSLPPHIPRVRSCTPAQPIWPSLAQASFLVWFPGVLWLPRPQPLLGVAPASYIYIYICK